MNYSSVLDWIDVLLAEIDQRWATSQSGPPGVVYHYTSDKAFRNIIQTGTLRASDTSQLPDKAELHRAADIFRSIAQDHALRAAQQGRPDLYPERLLTLDYARPTLMKCFVTSLTSTADDPGMWASYAVQGSGVALGFDSSQLVALDKANGSPQRLGFFQVSYREDQQRSFFEWLLNRWESRAISIPVASGSAGQLCRWRRFGVAIGCAAAVFPRMKKYSFGVENEWRLAHAHVSRDTDCCQVYTSSRRSYVELNFTQLISKLPIVSLWIGPANTIAEDSLHCFMRENGYSVPIEKSQLPSAYVNQ